MLLCMLSSSVPVCEHTQNSNGGRLRRLSAGLDQFMIVFKMNLLSTLLAAVVNTYELQMKKWQYFCNDFLTRSVANTIKNNFHFLFFTFFFFFSPYKNYKYFVLLFIFIQNNKLYKSSVTKQQWKWKQEKTKSLHWKIKGAKHSMFLPGPQTLICIQINFSQQWTHPKLVQDSVPCSSKCYTGTKLYFFQKKKGQASFLCALADRSGLFGRRQKYTHAATATGTQNTKTEDRCVLNQHIKRPSVCSLAYWQAYFTDTFCRKMIPPTWINPKIIEHI